MILAIFGHPSLIWRMRKNNCGIFYRSFFGRRYILINALSTMFLNAFSYAFAIALSLCFNTLCHSREGEKIVLRGIEDPFPSDCEMLSDEELKTANALCESAKNFGFRAEALAALQEYIVDNRKKSYAWWRWKMLAVSNKELHVDGLHLEISRIKVLGQEINRADDGRLESIITFYSLIDGTRVPHGPCILDDEGFSYSVGEFCHGLRHGRWVHWEGYDKTRKAYADGFWKNGKPWDGTLQLLLNGDNLCEEFREGKRKTKAGYETLDYTPQVILLSPNGKPDHGSNPNKKKGKKKSEENADSPGKDKDKQDPESSKNSSDP